MYRPLRLRGSQLELAAISPSPTPTRPLARLHIAQTMSSSQPPSLLSSIPADISYLASLPQRPDLLSLLPSASSTSPEPSNPSDAPLPAPPTAPQTADAALVIGRHLMLATEGDVQALEKEVEGEGDKLDRLRSKLEEVRDGLQDGSKAMGWTQEGGEQKEESLA